MAKAKYATCADGYKRRQITYRDATGATRTKRLTAKTDKELDDKIAAFYKSIGNGLALVNQKTTFGEYMDIYIDTNAPRWAPSTLYSVKCSAWHVRNKIGAAPLFAITSSMLIAIFSDSSPRYRSLVRCVFRSAVKDGLLLRDPSLCLV